MRNYIIAGGVVVALGIGSTMALGGYDDAFEFAGFDRDHHSAHYDRDRSDRRAQAPDRRRGGSHEDRRH